MSLSNVFNLIRKIDTKVGDEIVVYVVATRKAYFFHHADYGFRLKTFRNKRSKAILIRKSDVFIRIEKDGTLSKNKDGFVVQ